MDVSIIIVSYNTKDLLRNCLESIKAVTQGVSYEVIVVDNDSHDGSVEMLTSDFPWVRLIESGANLGFGKANNLGMENANGKYFFLLNSDTILLNNAIKIFFDYSEQHEQDKLGALGAILLGTDKKPCHSYGHFITPSSELKSAFSIYFRFLKDSSNLHPSFVTEPLNVEYITGADLWLPEKVYELTKGFNSAFFMYCEEVEWQKRIADAGLNRTIIPGPEIIHLEGGGSKSESTIWTPRRLLNLYTSKKYYHKNLFNKHIYPFFRILYLLLHIPSLMMLSVIKRDLNYCKMVTKI